MKKALDMIESLDIQRMVHMWEPLLNNMAHTLRKLKYAGFILITLLLSWIALKTQIRL